MQLIKKSFGTPISGSNRTLSLDYTLNNIIRMFRMNNSEQNVCYRTDSI